MSQIVAQTHLTPTPRRTKEARLCRRSDVSAACRIDRSVSTDHGLYFRWKRQVENDSKKSRSPVERIMNPLRWRAGGCKPFIHSYPNRTLYGNSIGNISILGGIAARGTVLLHPALPSLPFVSYLRPFCSPHLPRNKPRCLGHCMFLGYLKREIETLRKRYACPRGRGRRKTRESFRRLRQRVDITESRFWLTLRVPSNLNGEESRDVILSPLLSRRKWKSNKGYY